MTSRRTMPLCLSIVWIIAILIGPLANHPQTAQAASFDTIADRVLGQSGFGSSTPGAGATGLRMPWGVAVDQGSGRLYLADYDNNRVLSWPSAATFTNGQAADIVIGQPDFDSFRPNRSSATPSATSLYSPTYLAIDGSGNLFVSDTNNGRVLAYTAPITTGMAASRVFGKPNFTTGNSMGTGVGTLTSPTGIAVDGSGNLYIADSNRHIVQEFDAALTSDTDADRIFGQPSSGLPSGGPSNDRLASPMGITLDIHGNLYISDAGYNRVLEYDTPLLTDTSADRVFGQPHFFSTTAGLPSADSLDEPQSIAVDSNDNLYIADGANSRVLAYDTPLIDDTVADRVFGQPNFMANTPNIGGIGDHSLAGPRGIAVDSSGNLYIADTSNNRLLKYEQPTADLTLAITRMNPQEVTAGGPGFVLTVEGTNFTNGATVRWNGADRLTTFANQNRLIAQINVADIAATGTISITIANPGGDVSAAYMLTIYSSTPADTTADRVLGQPIRTSRTPKYGGTNAVGLNLPYEVAIQPGSGRIFVADSLSNRVLSWPDATAFTNGQAADVVIGQRYFAVSTINQTGQSSAKTLNSPQDVAADVHGNLYVADTGNHRVLIYSAPITSGMAASLVLGQPDFTSNAPNNGGVSANSLNSPSGLAIDEQGNLYVSDGNSRLLEYDTPLATDTTADHVFGQPNFSSSTPNNGGVSANSLSGVGGIALDSVGNVFVADSSNHRVLEYDAPLNSDTIADRVFGQPSFASSVANNGGISASSLFRPSGIVLDSAGKLYVADSNNHRVLEYDAPFSSDTIADRVFGQPNFSDSTYNNGGVGATSLYGPTGVAVDGADRLFIADTGNNRVLEYDLSIINPLPVITSLSQSEALAGSAGFTLTVTGTNFVAGSIVRWNDMDRPTNFVSNTQLTAQIDATDIASASVVSITVSSPQPGGGISSPHSFTINNPLPTITGLSQSEILAGSGGFTLTITGTNFFAGSIVRWNGDDRPTTSVSSTRLTAEIAAADLETAGTASITVFNPQPGGGASNALAFEIRPRHFVYLPLLMN